MNELKVKNESAIAEFENAKSVAKSVGAEIVASREAQEVQVAMVAAKRFPRDEITAYNRILNDCRRMGLATKAMYEFPRGGQVLTGPSIHLARAIARGWGNIDSGFKVLETSAKESTVMAYCWDLETNNRVTRVFTVQHFRQTKGGGYALTDPRDVYEMIANQAARRERSCILSVVPGDVVDAAMGECKATLTNGEKGNLKDSVRKMVATFQEKFGVTPDMLEAYIGCKKEAFSIQSIVRLRNVYTTLTDGSASIEQYFDISKTAPPAKNQDVSEEPVAQPAVQPAEQEVMSLDDL